MYLPRFIQHGLVLFACLVTCGMASHLDAQQPTPAAPRLFNPNNRAISNRYQPRFMQNAGTATGRQEVINDGYVGQPVAVDGGVINGGHVVGAPVNEVIIADGGYIEGGYSDGGCGDCGSSGCGGCGPLYDPRDCGINDDCWLGGLGGILCNTEYFSGVQAYKVQQFEDPQGQLQPENCSFGYHLGFNSGLPLYNITCGLVSGQIGLNYVRSNLNDGVLATGDREQTFVTAGLFRRVDYGLQFGAVADILHDQYVSELDIVQVRYELSWVWAGGSNFGFRSTRNVQDDSGFVGGVFLPQINGQAIDTYRLFYRRTCCNGGYIEWFYGRSDEQHNIYGADYDLPIGQRTALYAAFNYLQPDDDLRLTDNEAWNLQMGVTFRPRGRDWYKFYHRPLFKVAGNGNLIQSRKP